MTPNQIPYNWAKGDFIVVDEGASSLIDASRKGWAYVPLRTAGAEARTLLAPASYEQVADLILDVDGGDCTVTVKDSAGNTTHTLVFDDAGDIARLVSVKVGAIWKWVLIGQVGLSSGGAGVFSTITANSATIPVITAATSVGVTAADGLTVNGLIVPTIQYITIPVLPHATLTEQNLFIAKRALTVVSIDMVPDLVQGSALTGTVCKAVTTATPANGTTPMHAAGTLDFNATAHTVQSMTLTATGADLALAAGNRIGLDLSAALTTGRAVITIGYKFT